MGERESADRESKPKRTLRIAHEADEDLDEAYAYYETQQRGTGFRFLGAVAETLDMIIEFPGMYPIVHKRLHRALLDGFPYGIFYVVDGNDLTVLACIHGARDPRTWRRVAER